MDYFNVHDVPDGFLRARFKTASPADTEKLGEVFASVAIAMLHRVHKNQTLRMGFQALKKNTGKTTLARRIAECASDGSLPDVSLNGWSNKYRFFDDDDFLLHFDVEAIKTSKSLYTQDDLSMRMQREFSRHDIDRSDARMHLVEWPEKENIRANLNALWKISKDANENREFSLSCIDEIAEMDEFKQFLEDAAHLTLAAE